MYNRKSVRKYRHTLSDRESNVISGLSYSGKTIFTVGDVKNLVVKPKNLLDNLVRKRWILKIRKGVYAIAPLESGEMGAASYTLHSLVIASILIKPYFIGYWSALNHLGLTDATPPDVYVATTRSRNTCTILGSNFRFVTISRRKMFGVEEAVVENRKVLVSSKEKAVADCLDHPEHSAGVDDIAKAIYFHREEIDAKKLVSFAKRLGNSAVIKRLGYIAEILGLDDLSGLVSGINLGSGYSLLDPTLPKRGHIKERWRLVLNATIDEARWIK